MSAAAIQLTLCKISASRFKKCRRRYIFSGSKNNNEKKAFKIAFVSFLATRTQTAVSFDAVRIFQNRNRHRKEEEIWFNPSAARFLSRKVLWLI